VASLRRYSNKFFDCHLMMSEPGRYLEAFKKSGANGCTCTWKSGERLR